jgi:hypothetical protein
MSSSTAWERASFTVACGNFVFLNLSSEMKSKSSAGLGKSRFCQFRLRWGSSETASRIAPTSSALLALKSRPSNHGQYASSQRIRPSRQGNKSASPILSLTPGFVLSKGASSIKSVHRVSCLRIATSSPVGSRAVPVRIWVFAADLLKPCQGLLSNSLCVHSSPFPRPARELDPDRPLRP